MASTKLTAPMALLTNFIQVANYARASRHPGLRVPGTRESGLFNVGGAEIPAYDPITRRSFVVNARSATVDVLDLRNPSKPTQFGSLDVVADLAPRSVGGANSVDARFGILAVAVEAEPKQDDGWVAFYSTLTLKLLAVVPAGALPDVGESVARDLEPEYVTTDGDTAWVMLQEHDAIAVIDIRTGRVRKVFALGCKDHPKAIANFRSGDRHYLVTVNEGEACDCDAFAEKERVADLDFDRLCVPGGCSFSIWNAKTGALVFDSGAEGPGPEGVTLGTVRGMLYAFVGLGHTSRILVLDLTDPESPEFVDCADNRRFRDAAGQPVPACAASRCSSPATKSAA